MLCYYMLYLIITRIIKIMLCVSEGLAVALNVSLYMTRDSCEQHFYTKN